jgi:transmembrane sensor
VKLPDGTSVFLNSDSRLSFDANMNEKNERAVELEGEAFFDVVHLTGRPFVIHTNKVLIRVLGTSFNVKAYPNDKKSETTLIRGSIELLTMEGSRQKFILKPSEKFSLIERRGKSSGNLNGNKDKDSSTLLIENVAPVKLANKEYVPETSWTENKLIFENESLEDLAPKLERWFNVRINVVRKDPAGDRFTGAFANETIEQALSAMKLIKPFNYTINEKNITIY